MVRWCLQQVQLLRQRVDSRDKRLVALEGAIVMSACARAHMKEHGFWHLRNGSFPSEKEALALFKSLKLNSSDGADKMKTVHGLGASCEHMLATKKTLRVQITVKPSTKDASRAIFIQVPLSFGIPELKEACFAAVSSDEDILKEFQEGEQPNAFSPLRPFPCSRYAHPWVRYCCVTFIWCVAVQTWRKTT